MHIIAHNCRKYPQSGAEHRVTHAQGMGGGTLSLVSSQTHPIRTNTLKVLTSGEPCNVTYSEESRGKLRSMQKRKQTKRTVWPSPELGGTALAAPACLPRLGVMYDRLIKDPSIIITAPRNGMIMQYLQLMGFPKTQVFV